METSHKVALAGAVITAAAAIAAAFIGRGDGGTGRGDGGTGDGSPSTVFTTGADTSDRSCDQICRAESARCVGATRINGNSVDCEFRGVKTEGGFELRAKRCNCERLEM
jgi:hypothetical protein